MERSAVGLLSERADQMNNRGTVVHRWFCLIALLMLPQIAMSASLDATIFHHPPKQYRPWVYWWWFGNATPQDDLVYELQEMDRMGIGGVEIFPCYPLSEDDPTKGIQNVPLFSPQWQQRFAAVLQEANRRDMRVSLLGGSGWPFGGPWIDKALSSRALARGVVNVRGPRTVDISLPPPDADPLWTVDAVERVVAVNGEQERIVIPRPPMNGRLRWDAPAGEWRIQVFYRMLTNQILERGGTADTGLVLDHFNTKAMNVQLSKLATMLPTIRKFSTTFSTFDADSLELEDSNWTDDFLGEFNRRRGYDLSPYLPDLWEWTQPLSGAVRQDYFETISDLMIERYFRRYTDWAHENGYHTSIQAHGTIADVMRAYGVADKPDVETMWPGSWRQSVNLRSRRIGVSAAHIYGKPIVSSESYTWLNAPRFTVTLEQMKAATDSLFIDGVTQIKAQGFSSSPRAVGTPGWAFYASTFLSQNQTWWPHFGKLTAYISRLTYLMQSAHYVADVALYDDLPDAAAHYEEPKQNWVKDNVWRRRERDPGMDSAAMIAQHLKPCADRLQNAGYGFDIINDDALSNQMTLGSDGLLEGHDMKYRALVFYNSTSVPLETLKRAETFSRAGGLVIAVGHMPRIGVGLMSYQEKQNEVSATIDRIWKTGAGRFARDLDELQSILDRAFGPDFRVTGGDSGIGFIHRRLGDQDLYLVANGTANQSRSQLTFRTSANVIERWNPMDGSVVAIHDAQRNATSSTVTVNFNPWESTVFVFGPNPTIGATEIPPKFMAAEFKVEGPWNVSFPAPVAKDYLWPQLRDWINIDDTRYFSGIATYRCEVRLPLSLSASIPIEVDLGEVRDSAEVFVNGKSAGIAIMTPYRVETRGLFHKGHNVIEIRVANLWNNYIMSLPKTTSKVPGPGYGLSEVLYGPDDRKLRPSGLLGPVKIRQLESSAVAGATNKEHAETANTDTQ
jgi:hypothetical protein